MPSPVRAARSCLAAHARAQATLLKLLAFGTTSALYDMHAREGVALSKAMDVVMADWWQTTPATYFDSVSEANLIKAVTEACGVGVTKHGDTEESRGCDLCGGQP